MNFSANCICRAVPAPKILPVVASPMFVTGLLRLTWLRALNISQRNWSSRFPPAAQYSFTDARPLAGQAYYRLRQTDNDGRAAYSPVATVRGNAETSSYPNPAADALVLPAGLGPVRYRLLTGLGQALASGQAVGGDHLDLRTLPTGMFFLELTDTAGRRTQRLMRE